MTQDDSIHAVCEWLVAAQNRFRNMDIAGIDRNGYPAIKEALKHLETTGKLTLGQCQYIWNRTDSRGAVPDYNHYKGYNKKFGEMIKINLNDLVNSNLVDWSSGRSCMQPSFAKAIADDTDYKWQTGKLVKKPMIPVRGLFV